MPRYLQIVSAFIIGGLIGWGVAASWSSPRSDDEPNSTEIRQGGGYDFVNPLLECESSDGTGDRLLSIPKREVQEIVDRHLRNGDVTHVSVYFRDLDNGPWFGIDERAQFAPQSLLKVPLMMAYLYTAEDDPGVLDAPIVFDPALHGLPSFSSDETLLVVGASYPTWDLIERMVVDSDNGAFGTLSVSIDQAIVEEVHRDLGIAYPDVDSPTNFIDVKTYASLYRVLYNASYVSRGLSERALELLSRTRFADGLVAGAPTGTRIAHKYGIREIDDASGQQLHDCGIIYYTGNPSLLCIMTQGDDIPTLRDIIREITERISIEIAGTH